MKTTNRGLAFLTLALLLGLTHLLRAGITVSEPPDFSNTPPGTNYNLTTGTNTFSGMVTTPSDGQDNFQVTVPVGQQILSVTATISGASSFQGGATFNTQQFLSGTGSGTYPIGNVPLPAQTYGALVNADFSVGNPWMITITMGPVPDYSIIISGGTMTVTNNTGGNDTLTISEPSSGTIAFATSPPGRTFRVNTGTLNTNSSGTVSLTGVTSIQINGGSGNETINVGAFANTNFPSLAITCGVGANTVSFTGSIPFKANNSLSVDATASSAGTVNVNNAAHLVASGGGTITILCSKNVSLSGGAVLQTVDGAIDVEANQQATATGNFNGVNLDGAGTMIKTTSNGNVTVNGTGGNDGGGLQLGVNVTNGAQIITSTLGQVNVTGVGGAGAGVANRGVTVYGQGSAITAGDRVIVTGTGGTLGGAFGIGVSVLYGGVISSGPGGTAVTGAGAGAAGSTSNDGVEIAEVGSSNNIGSLITSASSNLSITGTAGGASGFGLHVYHSGAVTCPASGKQIDISADSLSIDSTATISTVGAAGFVKFTPMAPATQLNIGGDNAPGVLGVTNAELARVSTALLLFGANAGDITFGAPVTPTAGTNVQLNASGAIHATAPGTDLSLGTGTLKLFTGTLACPITGTTADASPGYPQLNVAGNVNLNGVPLDLSGTTYAGALGDQFTIVKNSGSGTTTTGTFNGLPEGAYLVWPGSNTQVAAQITYVGGTSGHDVVLTLVLVAQALTVRNTNSDTSLGSLQSVLAFAAAHPGADTITFDPSLNVAGGATITLTGSANVHAITIGDSAGVTIDASSLINGLTIQGGGPSGNFGLFHVNIGANLTLRNLTLANGGGSAFASAGNLGGAIESSGTVTLIDCTLMGNSADTGGAIINSGRLTLIECTLSGNHATIGNGGAIVSLGTLTVVQCTLSSNSAAGFGEGIFCGGSTVSVTLTNSIVAGNTSTGADIAFQVGAGSVFTVSGANIVQSIVGIARDRQRHHYQRRPAPRFYSRQLRRTHQDAAAADRQSGDQ